MAPMSQQPRDRLGCFGVIVSFFFTVVFVSSIFKAAQYWSEHRYAGAIPATLMPVAILACGVGILWLRDECRR
jgi:hypothetical protein